jgi:predicted acetyltransferase
MTTDIFSWQKQSEQFPQYGSGIVYFEGVVGDGKWVDCLLYYDKEHNLSGILYHYPFDFTYEKRGNCNILVKPEKRRQGIATALLKKGMKRFRIDLKNQKYSESGKHFIKAYKSK